MNARVWGMGCAVLLVAACDEFQEVTRGPADGFLGNAPESVLAIAAPNQDLTAVRVDPTSGCYLYRHRGPVETTLLPLRTVDGRPICTGSVDPQVAG